MAKKVRPATESVGTVGVQPKQLIVAVLPKNDEQQNLLKTINSNTITFVDGPAGSGKCVRSDDSYVFSEYGITPIAEMGHAEADCYTEISVAVTNRHGQFERAAYFYNSGRRPTIRIRGNHGYEIEATRNHRILALRNTGVEWVRMDELRLGDFACICRQHPIREGGTESEVEDAYFIGLMVGDGSYTLPHAFSFSSKDDTTRSFFIDYCSRRFGKEPYSSSCRKYDLILGSVPARNSLKELGLDQVKCAQKSIPAWIMSGPTTVSRAVLKGLMDTDGWIEKGGAVCFLSKSAVLAKQVHLLLAQEGIISKRFPCKKTYKGEKKVYWKVTVLLSSIRLFSEKIGFRIDFRKRRLETILQRKRNTNSDVLPQPFAQHLLKAWYRNIPAEYHHRRNPMRWYMDGSRAIGYDKLEGLAGTYQEEVTTTVAEIVQEKYFFERIDEISSGEAECSDLSVPETNSFVCNGFVCHNTFVAVNYGLQMLLREKYERLVFTRPVMEAAGEKLGYLPGDVAEKFDPYMYPIFDALGQMIPEEMLRSLSGKNGSAKIMAKPLAFMRGITFRNTYVVLDEAQNCTPKQVRLLLTRIGENSKVVVTGDTRQSDINTTDGLKDALLRFAQVAGTEHSIGMVRLTSQAIVRHPLIALIEELYAK